MDERSAVTFEGREFKSEARAQTPVTSWRILDVHRKEIVSSVGECYELILSAADGMVRGRKSDRKLGGMGVVERQCSLMVRSLLF